MITLLVAVLLVMAFGVAMETRFRVPRFVVVAAGAVQVGRLTVAGVVYRPGRVYVRVGRA